MSKLKTFVLLVSMIIGYNARKPMSLANKVNILERRIASESNFRSHETAIIFQRLDEIDQNVNRSLESIEKICNADTENRDDKRLSNDKTSIQPDEFTINGSLTMWNDIMKLKRAFSGEKLLNSKIRDIFPMLKTEIEQYQTLTSDLQNETEVLNSIYLDLKVENTKQETEIRMLELFDRDLQITTEMIKDNIQSAKDEASRCTLENIDQEKEVLELQNDNRVLKDTIEMLSYEMQNKSDNHATENAKHDQEIQQLKRMNNDLQNMVTLMTGDMEKMTGYIEEIKDIIDIKGRDILQIKNKIDTLSTTQRVFASCADALDKGYRQSGVYNVTAGFPQEMFMVYCDQTTDGGGWIVFQRRMDGSVDFYRGWKDYKRGFGNQSKEFWLGNERLSELTASGMRELRIDMEDFAGKTAYARYKTFKIYGEDEKYKLEVKDYSGNASDSLTTYHNGMKFSTNDDDNDASSNANCAKYYTGAWWYKSCHSSNLNGKYYMTEKCPAGKGINWYYWKDSNAFSLKFVEMKLR